MKHQLEIENVSRETIDQIRSLFLKNESALNDYADLLLDWNTKINLMSRSTTKEVLVHHIKHSLCLIHLMSKENIYVDAGCGGGLPGIPLAIVMKDRNFLLNDKIGKKIIAVDQMNNQLGLKNVHTKASDLSALKIEEKNVAIISKHAFKTADLLKRTKLLKPKAIYLLKGADFKSELDVIKQKLSLRALDLSEMGAFFKDKFMIKINLNEKV